MKFSGQYRSIAVADIEILRKDRQRRVITTDDLEGSMRERGLYQPIILRETEDGKFTLVAGERRLTTAIKLGWDKIPSRLVSDLDETEAKIVELEENVKRKNLDWRDEVRAIGELHKTYLRADEAWNLTRTSKTLDMGLSRIQKCIRVASELENPKIATAPGLEPAYNILMRIDDRKTADAMNDVISTSLDMFEPLLPGIEAPTEVSEEVSAEATPGSSPIPVPAAKPLLPTIKVPRIKPAEESILHESFLEWAPKYKGEKFNFIHCDFPYGIDVFAGKFSGSQKHETYDDSSNSYWELLKCLCSNLDRLMMPSAHMMFWYSMEYHTITMQRFREWAPSLHVQSFPVIWVKSDNVGILNDSRRVPRRIYETALIASREDRLICRATSNAYSSPTDKAHHPSTKPEPMLKYFFQMFVDEHTRMLDPTCGGGSALRAAESLGAPFTLGLEKSAQYHDNAVIALRTFRTLRAATK